MGDELEGVAIMEGVDGGLLLLLQPEEAGDRCVVPVGDDEPLAPVTELAQGNRQPTHQENERSPGANSPMADKVDKVSWDSIAHETPAISNGGALSERRRHAWISCNTESQSRYR